MNFYLNEILSLSIAISAITGWIRFRKTDPAFFPFLWYVWGGLMNEIIAICVIEAGYSNALYYNLFLLFEAIVLTLQFKRWGLFNAAGKQYKFIQAGNIFLWVFTSFLYRNVFTFNSYYTILHAAVLVIMSINKVNDLLFTRNKALLKEPVFLICMSFIIFFTYSIHVEASWLFGINQSRAFRVHILEILSYINLFTNLIFALAILWMPMKRKYIY